MATNTNPHETPAPSCRTAFVILLAALGVRTVQIYTGGMENERSWVGRKDIAAIG